MPKDAAFTTYVRALLSGHEPAAATFETAWAKLRRLLVSELKRRSLWAAPPTYLGVYGYSRWSDREAFEELAVDCFQAVFVERMNSLTVLLAGGAQIDGLCLQNLRFFLHERQKKHDPLGYRVYNVLRGAVRRLIETGTLHVLEGDPRVRNATVLGFAPETETGTGGADLAEHLETWPDEVLPELVTAPPARLEEVKEKLGSRLVELAGSGVESFRFKEVVDPLKSCVHKWRDAVWEFEVVAGDEGDRDFVSIVHQVRPGAEYEERQFFDKLVECVSEALPRAVKTKKSGAQLEKYWNFLRSQVADDRADQVPSRRKIGQLLEIQRTRIPEFNEILRREIERCRQICRRPTGQGGVA